MEVILWIGYDYVSVFGIWNLEYLVIQNMDFFFQIIGDEFYLSFTWIASFGFGNLYSK